MTGKLTDKRFKELIDKNWLSVEKLTPAEHKEFHDHYKEIRDEAIMISTNAIMQYYESILAKHWKGYSESL